VSTSVMSATRSSANSPSSTTSTLRPCAASAACPDARPRTGLARPGLDHECACRGVGQEPAKPATMPVHSRATSTTTSSTLSPAMGPRVRTFAYIKPFLRRIWQPFPTPRVLPESSGIRLGPVAVASGRGRKLLLPPTGCPRPSR
jgi:hypothetical protein